jgi:hypothetical protein
MTREERAVALGGYGFTQRQATFLATVMVHAGVCVQRQYATFTGCANGHNVREFFNGLVADQFATAYACAKGGNRVYHIHHKGLYAAIGEPNNRHRRATPVARAMERLMMLDAVLAEPDIAWLATEREKVAHFVHHCGVPTPDLPALVFEGRGVSTARYFPDKLPIGTSAATPNVTFLYAATEPHGRGLHAFLDRHRALLLRLARWRLRAVFPAFLEASQPAYRDVFTAFCAPAVRPAVLEEFRWFCEERRARESGHEVARNVAEQSRYQVARRAFGAPRFFEAYRRWRTGDETRVQHLLSSRLYDGVQRGDIRWETSVLPHQYLHLARVVATA